MAKKKNLLEKAAEAIDHALHPDPKKEKEPVEKSVAKADADEKVNRKKSSQEESDYASHPKFAKFLKKGATK